MSAAVVTTTIGDIREDDLEIKMIPQEDTEQVWVVARECRYRGNNPELAKHVGELVRRDVWATIKHGHAMVGKSEL